MITLGSSFESAQNHYPCIQVNQPATHTRPTNQPIDRPTDQPQPTKTNHTQPQPTTTNHTHIHKHTQPADQSQTPNAKRQTPLQIKLQTSNFELQTSNFKLQTSNFKLQTSNFKLQTSSSKLPASQLPSFPASQLPSFQASKRLHACTQQFTDHKHLLTCMFRRRSDQTAFGLICVTKHAQRACLILTPSKRVFHTTNPRQEVKTCSDAQTLFTITARSSSRIRFAGKYRNGFGSDGNGKCYNPSR